MAYMKFKLAQIILWTQDYHECFWVTCKSPLMKLNKTCFIITQLPRALVHSGSDVDYHVASGITGTSVAAPVLPYTHCQEGDV